MHCCIEAKDSSLFAHSFTVDGGQQQQQQQQQQRGADPSRRRAAYEAISGSDGDQWGLHHGVLKSGGCISNGPQEEEAISKLASPSSSGLLARAFIPLLTKLLRNIR
ncbi:hypothetical protein Q8A73_011206 [Channa argus]|nr:hypothetical protein Q8A73_011206 [Channa argus]